MKLITLVAIGLSLCLSLSLRGLRSYSNTIAFVPLEESELPEECDEISEFLRELRSIPKCGLASSLRVGDICEGGHGEGTSNKLNNCGRFDLYRVSEPCTATPMTEEFLPPECDQISANKAYLRALPRCDTVGAGELCEGDGECGTDRRLNNCGAFDLYRRDGGDGQPSPRPTPRPTFQPTTVPPTSQLTGPFKFPLYSQQCRDDAGPAWGDDEEIYGEGRTYHSGSNAIAVLQDGECPDPLKGACAARAGPSGQVTHEVSRAAYLEGPLQCGGKGWFCRILPDANHGGLTDSYGDWNFNHCNRTDYGDTDGHCHGSDNDDVYYWWVRDHWHRGYAGRLHCCCDWGATLGVVARCDYRAPLQPGENERCRDANEDHDGPGSGFSKGFEAGCPVLGPEANPLPEPSNAQCWDVLNFAPIEND